MNQDKFSESAKHYLVVRNFSIFPRVPIVETDLQFITWHIMMQCYASLLCPLVLSMNKDLITAIGLYALPCGNAITIGINLLGNTLDYFLFQARCAWGMYYVVHIFVPQISQKSQILSLCFQEAGYFHYEECQELENWRTSYLLFSIDKRTFFVFERIVIIIIESEWITILKL